VTSDAVETGRTGVGVGTTAYVRRVDEEDHEEYSVVLPPVTEMRTSPSLRFSW
jgi:hypothetical protein